LHRDEAVGGDRAGFRGWLLAIYDRYDGDDESREDAT